ncbi:MAG: hypothetical protein HBSAPP03_00140 [Phycisphaerae bacterium]|nr:MAG: hypothetical protein HBSAPP03_00140 [Phycisphaerae bacterium]
MRRHFPWPGMIFVLLAGNVAIVGVTVVASARSAHPQERAYEADAPRWDGSPAQHARNEMLGWRVIAHRPTPANPVVLRVTDGAGRPLRAARVFVELSNGVWILCPPADPGAFHTPPTLGSPATVRTCILAGLDVFTAEVSITPEGAE